MKIVILQDRLRLGGTEVQALALGQLWQAAGHEVRLIVFRQGGALEGSRVAKKMSVKTLQPIITWLDGWAPGLEKAVTDASPDVVVAFGREANAKLSRLKKLPSPPVLVATLRSGREQPERFWRGLKAADAVVANASWAAAEARQNGVAEERLNTIYSGLARSMAVANPDEARTSWRKRAHTREGAVVLVCVAGFRPGKGQDILLHAVSKLPPELNWQLWFVGAGIWQKACQKVAVQFSLQEKVRFAGLVADPAPIYAAADVAVLASLAEALPNFLIEAQAAGLPVVATAVGGVTECFMEGKTGYGVPEGEMEALVTKLAQVIKDEAWRKSAREPAQARAKELFDADRNAAKWLEVFETLRKTKR
jgi:glycosyltransferase involved in cell wall biosynthesis